MRYPRSLALLGLVLQLGIMFWLGWRGLLLETDNRIERFAVQGHAEESAYRDFRQWFPDREVLLVCMQLPNGEADFALAENLLDRLGKVIGPHTKKSWRDAQAPNSSLDPGNFPFPFWQPKEGLYSAFLMLDLNQQRHQTLVALREAAAAIRADHPELGLFLAGEPLVNDALDQGATNVRFRFFPLLIGFSLCLLGWLFKRWSILVLVGLSVGTALSTTMGFLSLRGQPLNLITTLVPALVFVLAVAMQIHVLMGIAIRGDVWAGLRCKWRANFLVSLTTSIGFASLITSHVKPIAELGVAMVIGIWSTFLWTHLTYLTWGRLCPPQPTAPAIPGLDHFTGSVRYWSFLAKPIWLIVPALAIVGGATALLHNPQESNGLNYFPAHHPVRQMTDFVENHLTGATQLDVLLLPPTNAEKSSVYLPEPSASLALEHDLIRLANVRHGLSAYSIVTPYLAPDAPPLAVRTAVSMLSGQSDPLTADLLNPNAYRIRLLVNNMDKPAYRLLRDAIERRTANSPWSGRVLVTGPLDRVIAIQSYLLTTLGQSLLITVGLVLLAMWIAMRRKRYLAAIILANGFPLGMMALAMPVFQIPTTISTVMVFSVAFGIAVDDSIHLLHTCRESEGRFEAAWHKALHQDLRAVCLTSLALAGGFLILMTASFLPTRHFGLLLVVGLGSALVGDLFFLPLILRYSEKRRPRHSTT